MGVVVIVVVVMIVRMTMIMVMFVTMACISAAHRVKGCDDLMHIGTKALQHRLDDVVAQNQNSVGCNCRRQVTITDMPGEFGKMSAIVPGNFVERLVSSDDAHDCTVVENQLISREQHDGLWKVYENVIPVCQGDGLAPQMALIVLQYGRTERR
jgi:hypothetical protein